MNWPRFLVAPSGVIACAILLSSCGGTVSGSGTKTPTSGNTSKNASQYQLQVTESGSGAVKSSPAGIDCGSACTASFAAGTTVTLTATPAQGMTFAGWSGACSGSGTCSVQVNANTSVAAAFTPIAVPPPSFTGLLTYHGDNKITGLNANETLLTPANVNPNQFGKLFTRPLDGWVFAQPLYVNNVNVSGKGTFDVVYVATEHDTVYAYDASGSVSSPLWQKSFIDPAAGITTIPYTDIFNNQDEGKEVGITSTPVIDPSTGTMYLVAATKENGSYFQRLHAIDISTGAEKFGGPVAINGSVNGTGKGSVNGVVTFDPLVENQRAALLLANGNIYIGFSSHGDQGNNHGWLFAYSAANLSRVAFWCTSPNDWDATIWGAGTGLAADDSGNIYAVTSNGNFNLNSGGKNAGDSYVKLSPGLSILDYFTPYDQATLNTDDLDVGASGVLLVPDAQSNTTHAHIAVGANKRGDLYVMDRDDMGKYQTSSNTNIVQYLPRAVGNSSGDQYFGTGAYWNGNLYFAGSYDNLKQFSLKDGLLSATPIFESPEVVATSRSARPVVSSSGSTSAIVWVIATDANAATPTLRAYDAANISHELYNSTQNAARDTPTGGILKFNSPTIANGKVYFAARGDLNVYGLLP